MANRFYSPDDQRAAKVRALFSTIARRYDRLNDLMTIGLHHRWKQRLITLTGHPHHALDLCCGTGDIACRLTGHVTGVDFTSEMLQIAITRSTTVNWIQADALHLPFPDNTFDVVTIGYGLRNLADLNNGLHEIHRVLCSGGQLLTLDLGKPDNPFWRTLYFTLLRLTLPALGWLFHGNADTYSYLLASLRAYPAQRGVKNAMETTGFTACDFQEFVGGAMALNTGVKR